MLLDHIAATNWGSIVRVIYNDKPSTIQTHFKTALEQRSPTIILIDGITKLIGKEQSSRQVMIETIGEGLDALANKARQQNMRPHVLVVATCLDFLNDIPLALQRPGRFEEHIALPVPDAKGRKEILRYHKPTFGSDVFDQYISDLGDRTHAYTGADLRKVLYRATKAWRKRVGSPSKAHPLKWDDVVKGLQEVRPTAMHDINLKPPTVRWSDIGGYEDVKVALQRVLRHPTVRFYLLSNTSNCLAYRTMNLGASRQDVQTAKGCAPLWSPWLLQDHDGASHGNGIRLQLLRSEGR